MWNGATVALAGVVGREMELGTLRAFLEGRGRDRALLLTGPAGIGKTTLWEAGVELGRGLGMRTLVGRPSGAEARHSFASLIDLFEGVDVGALASVPAPQRSALEAALLRADPGAAPAGPQAIALGVLNVLRGLAADERLLVAVDDVQWLDRPSADALVFAARRLASEPVVFLLARRPSRVSPLERELARPGVERLELGPLNLGASRRLLSERLGLVLSRQLLRHVQQASLGNPLFVLELGRTLLERGVPGIGEDLPVPDAVEELLGTRVAALAPELRRVLLAVALSADLRVDELAAVVSFEAVEEAVDAGLLLIDGARVRPSHPLLAAAAKDRSRLRERRELHRALASAVGDDELRALHLAVATMRPDAGLASTVAAAAGEASARGARAAAVTLAEHALRLTPDDASQRAERLLQLAGYLEAAGEERRLADLLLPAVDSLPGGGMRARAFLLLGEGAHLETAGDYERYLNLALAEAEGDRGLHASVLATKAMNTAAAAVARIAEAERWALQALPGAARAGPEVERRVLYALGWARALRGGSIDELCERFREASDTAFYIAHSPVRVAGQRLVWRGQVNEARATLAGLLALADERGEPASYALARLHLCELELRVGEWDAASRLLDEWADSAERELLLFPMYERCRALLAAGRGVPAEAERWAGRAAARAEAVGSRWDWLEALRARGIAALLADDPASASESLSAVWAHCRREGVDEPGVFPVAPELVEALVELGELDRARAVTDRLAELAEQQEHPWGLASVKRCRALLALASRREEDSALVALGEAAQAYERLGLRFDAARVLLSLGRAQRRLRKWAAARGSLQAAVAAFDRQGSPGWATLTRSELGRVGSRRPGRSGELTASEQQVVRLAVQGRSNKEIARALHVTVNTVEAHLSHAYAKLGVRSRAQLAHQLSTAKVSGFP